MLHGGGGSARDSRARFGRGRGFMMILLLWTPILEELMFLPPRRLSLSCKKRVSGNMLANRPEVEEQQTNHKEDEEKEQTED